MRKVLKFSEVELLEQPCELVDKQHYSETSHSTNRDESVCEEDNIDYIDEHTECLKDTTKQADSVYHEIVEQAKAEAEKILQKAEIDAKHKAEMIIQDAYEMSTKASEEMFIETHKKLADMENKAKEQGIQQGRQQALDEHRELIEELVVSMENLIPTIEQKHENFLKEWESELRWLALQISRKSLDKLISENELEMENMVLAAVSCVKDSDWIDVEVSSSCTELIGRLKQVLKGADAISVSSTDLPYGEVKICTDSVILDVSVEKRLANIEKYFLREGI